MCKSFEMISGKKNKGNKSLLEGLTKMYRDAGYKTAIVSVPVEIMEIDTRYQTEVRTERDLRYLIDNWNENKLLPLIGVPHWETGEVFLVDGYGRWVSSQVVDKEKYKYLDVLLILNAPENPEMRLEFEAEMYAHQNNQVAKMTAIQKHGAMLIMHDKATEKLEELRKEYGFEYSYKQGNREATILGSYANTLKICRYDDGKCATYIFDILRDAGFDRKANGYAVYIMNGLADIYKLYANNRETTKRLFSEMLRGTTPATLKSNAVAKYPILDFRSALSLYLEDIVVEELGLNQSREISGTRLTPIKRVV